MDRCTKFKIFNLALIFCLLNFFLYRFFAYPGLNPLTGRSLQAEDPDRVGGAHFGHHHDHDHHHDHHHDNDINTNVGLMSAAGQKKDTAGGGDKPDKPGEPAVGDPTGQKDGPMTRSHPNANSNTNGQTHANANNNNNDNDDNKAEGNRDKGLIPNGGVPKVTDTGTGPSKRAGTDTGTGESTAKKDTDANTDIHSKPGETGDRENREDRQSTDKEAGSLPACPLTPPNLNGPLATYTDAVSFEKIAEKNKGLQLGGRYKPAGCVARHRVAVVIPYRNREKHLKILLNNLHPMLIRQQLDYGVFVIDQELPTRFNRAMLMNIGFVEALKRYDYQCAIFHDVDLIPENDHNIYSCPQMPRHLSAAIDKFNYRLPYAGIYGGVSAMTSGHMRTVNGFSNLFFGWGGEDDDMATRIRSKGLKISRYPMEVARYRMIKHTHEKGNEQNPQRHSLLRYTSQRMGKDGLNSLKYEVKKVIEHPTHLQIVVFIDEKDYKT